MPWPSLITKALSPSAWRLHSGQRPSSSTGAAPDGVVHISSSLSRPTPDMPMRSMRAARNSSDRVPEINAVLQHLMKDEVVPQMGRQLAAEWQKLSVGLQTPSMSGRISTPKLDLALPEVLNRLESGTLKLTLPLKPGPINLAGLRQVVKTGTYLAVTLKVQSGLVNTEATQLSVWRHRYAGRGVYKRTWCSPSQLSGPASPLPGLKRLAGFKGINFDELGNFKVNLTGLSWNLNSYLGLSAGRPLGAGDFIGGLLQKSDLSSRIPIADAQSVLLTPERMPQNPNNTESEANAEHNPAIVSSQPASSNEVNTSGQTNNASAPASPEWIDWAGMHFQFTGEFMPGDLNIGEQSVLSLAPGTKVAIADANPTRLSLKFSAHLNRAQLMASGSHWLCGAGRVAFELALDSAEPLGTPDRLSLHFSELAVRDVALQVPANLEDESGRPLNHQLHLAALEIKSNDLNSQASHESIDRPIIAYDRSASRHQGEYEGERGFSAENDSSEWPPDTVLKINLPKVRLSQASAIFHTVGAGHGSGRLQMGLDDGAWAKKPMTLTAAVKLNTQREASCFDVHGQVEAGRLDLVANGEGRRARMGFVSSQNISLRARTARLEGNGEFGFRQRGAEAAHLFLTSEQRAQPWRVVIEDYDAQLLDPRQGLLVEVYDRSSQRQLSPNDEGSIIEGSGLSSRLQSELHTNSEALPAEPAVASGPRSQLMVRSLAFGGERDALPSFDAAGVLAVTLGGLQYHGAESDKNLNLQGGSHGELIIQKAYWAPQAPSPEVAAELRLTAGGDVRFTASDIKTLEGADIGVRISDQGAQLTVNFNVQADGRVVCDTSLSLREGQVRTRVLQMTPIQFATLKQRLRADPSYPMSLSAPSQSTPSQLTSQAMPVRASVNLVPPARFEPLLLRDVAPALRLASVDDLVYALIPRLKLDTQFLPILRAVHDAQVCAELPLNGLQSALPAAIQVQKSGRGTLNFEVREGKVVRGQIDFEPSLNIRWGVVTFQLKQIELAQHNPGGDSEAALVVRPSVGIKFLGLPTYVPNSVQVWAAGKCLEAFLGRPDLPDALSPLVSVLADADTSLNERMSAHLVIQPQAERKKIAIHAGLGPYQQPEKNKVSTGAQAGKSVTDVALPSADKKEPRDVKDKKEFTQNKGALVNIKAHKVKPFKLELGEDQVLACGPSSTLSMTLQDDLFKLQGHLDLSGEACVTQLKTPGGYTLSFDEGGVDVNAAFAIDAINRTQCELTNLSVKNLRLTADALGFTQEIRVPFVRQGQLKLDLQSDEPRLSCEFDPELGGAPFSMSMDGVSAIADQQYGARGLTLEGGLKTVEFTSAGLSLNAPLVSCQADQLILPLSVGHHVVAALPHLSAQALINVDIKGGVTLDFLDCTTLNDASEPLSLSLYDQQTPLDNFKLGPLTAQRLTFAFGAGVERPGFLARDIQCDQVTLEKNLALWQENIEEGSALGLGKIRLEYGSVTLSDLAISDTDYRFEGQLRGGLITVQDLLLRAGGLALQAPQLAVSGDMQFKILPDALSLLPLNRVPLSIRGVLSEVGLVTRSPQMSLLLQGDRQLPNGQLNGPTLKGRMVGLDLAQGEALAGTVRFAETVVRGRLSQGEIVVGPEDSALNRVQLHSGEADVDIQTLALRLADDGADSDLLLRARLQLESEVRDVRQPGSVTTQIEGSDVSEPLPIELFVERMQLEGQLNLTLDALLHMDPRNDFNTWIESAVHVLRGAADVDVRGRVKDLRTPQR